MNSSAIAIRNFILATLTLFALQASSNWAFGHTTPRALKFAEISIARDQQDTLSPDVPVASTATETLIANFAEGINAVTTQQEYSGPVEITVSGIGQASATQYSDAFYLLTDIFGNRIPPLHPSEYYNWVLWINGQHAEDLIPGQTVPAYEEDQAYTFQINAPGGRLTFGVGDTYTGDNTGSYTITVGKENIQNCSMPFFSQRDARWNDHPLRTNGVCSARCGTIGSCGCTLTSAAMIFAYYGVETTPPILSDCMMARACPFNFDAGPECMGGNVSFAGSSPWSNINKELNENKRTVILELWHNSQVPHWVVVTNGSGQDPNNYLINDPWAYDGSGTTLSAYIRQGYYPNRLALYDGEPVCGPTRDQSTVDPPALLLDEASMAGAETAVYGTVILNKLFETSLVVRLAAQSTDADIVEMQVWTDSHPDPDWQPYSEFYWLPWEPGDKIYARFRDGAGNVSDIFQDTLHPANSPADPLTQSQGQILLPLIRAD